MHKLSLKSDTVGALYVNQENNLLSSNEYSYSSLTSQASKLVLSTASSSKKKKKRASPENKSYLGQQIEVTSQLYMRPLSIHSAFHLVLWTYRNHSVLWSNQLYFNSFLKIGMGEIFYMPRYVWMHWSCLNLLRVLCKIDFWFFFSYLTSEN